MAAEGEAVTILHTYDAPFAARLEAYGVSSESISLYSDVEKSRCERELDSLIALANGTAAVRGVVERGDAIDRLFQHIEELKPSLTILGKHERRRSRQASRTGSVSRHAAMFAPTNVLIVTAGSGTRVASGA
jgi:nucleotide-binding universal stress UspA family protein